MVWAFLSELALRSAYPWELGSGSVLALGWEGKSESVLDWAPSALAWASGSKSPSGLALE